MILGTALGLSACASPAPEVTDAPEVTVPTAVDSDAAMIAIPVRAVDPVDLTIDASTAAEIPLATVPSTPASLPPASEPEPEAITPRTSRGPMPASFVAIRGGEAVLLIDANTGNSKTLRQVSLAADTEDAPGPSTPRTVDVDLVHATVWSDDCCLDGLATVLATSLDGATEASPLPAGFPAVNQRGDLVAVSTGGAIEPWALDADTGTSTSIVSSVDLESIIGGDVSITSMAWSFDGRTLAAQIAAGDQPTVAMFEVAPDGSSIVIFHTLDHLDEVQWGLPTFGADGLLRVIENTQTSAIIRAIDVSTANVVWSYQLPVAGVMDIDVDPSGTWWVLIDGHGNASAFDGFSLAALPGAGYSAASW